LFGYRNCCLFKIIFFVHYIYIIIKKNWKIYFKILILLSRGRYFFIAYLISKEVCDKVRVLFFCENSRRKKILSPPYKSLGISSDIHKYVQYITRSLPFLEWQSIANFVFIATLQGFSLYCMTRKYNIGMLKKQM